MNDEYDGEKMRNQNKWRWPPIRSAFAARDEILTFFFIFLFESWIDLTFYTFCVWHRISSSSISTHRNNLSTKLFKCIHRCSEEDEVQHQLFPLKHFLKQFKFILEELPVFLVDFSFSIEILCGFYFVIVVNIINYVASQRNDAIIICHLEGDRFRKSLLFVLKAMLLLTEEKSAQKRENLHF